MTVFWRPSHQSLPIWTQNFLIWDYCYSSLNPIHSSSLSTLPSIIAQHIPYFISSSLTNCLNVKIKGSGYGHTHTESCSSCSISCLKATIQYYLQLGPSWTLSTSYIMTRWQIQFKLLQYLKILLTFLSAIWKFYGDNQWNGFLVATVTLERPVVCL